MKATACSFGMRMIRPWAFGPLLSPVSRSFFCKQAFFLVFVGTFRWAAYHGSSLLVPEQMIPPSAARKRSFGCSRDSLVIRVLMVKEVAKYYAAQINRTDRREEEHLRIAVTRHSTLEICETILRYAGFDLASFGLQARRSTNWFPKFTSFHPVCCGESALREIGLETVCRTYIVPVVLAIGTNLYTGRNMLVPSCRDPVFVFACYAVMGKTLFKCH